jgi:hypothetical protein
MCPVNFSARRLKHVPCECALLHMVPKIAARDFVEAHGIFAGSGSSVTVPVKHEKTTDLPSPPFVEIA